MPIGLVADVLSVPGKERWTAGPRPRSSGAVLSPGPSGAYLADRIHQCARCRRKDRIRPVYEPGTLLCRQRMHVERDEVAPRNFVPDQVVRQQGQQAAGTHRRKQQGGRGRPYHYPRWTDARRLEIAIEVPQGRLIRHDPVAGCDVCERQPVAMGERMVEWRVDVICDREDYFLGQVRMAVNDCSRANAKSSSPVRTLTASSRKSHRRCWPTHQDWR